MVWASEITASASIATWLEDFVLQLSHHLGHEGGVRVGKEGDRGHKRPAVVVHNVLAVQYSTVQ